MAARREYVGPWSKGNQGWYPRQEGDSLIELGVIREYVTFVNQRDERHAKVDHVWAIMGAEM